MAQGKIPDEELNGVTGGSGRSPAYHCSEVEDDQRFLYYLHLAGPENDCPRFVLRKGEGNDLHHCLFCTNLETIG